MNILKIISTPKMKYNARLWNTLHTSALLVIKYTIHSAYEQQRQRSDNKYNR